MLSMLERRPSWLTAAALALGTLVLYALVVPGEFVFDDHEAILKQPVVLGELPLSDVWRLDFWGHTGGEGSGGLFRPLVTLWFAFDWWWSGGASWAFHLTNVLLHALVVAVLFLSLRELTAPRVALAAAVLFAVLAAPAEAVQGIVGRADVLATLALVAGLFFVGRDSVWSPVGLGLCLAIGLGAKESGAFAPLVWLLVARLRPWRERRYVIASAVVLVLVAAVYAALRYRVLGLQGPTIAPLINPLVELPSGARILAAGEIFLTRYVAGLFDPSRRLYVCSAPACGPVDASDPAGWVGLALLATLAVLALLLWRRSAQASVALGWFLLLFLPVSNVIIPSSTVYAERLLYAPIIGLCWAAALGVDALARRSRPVIAWGALGTLAVANAAALQVRHLDWRTQPALYLSALELAPDAGHVQVNAAFAYQALEEWEAAEVHAREALRLDTRWRRAWMYLGMAADQQGRSGEAEAFFAKADPNDVEVIANRVVFLGRHRRFDEAAEVLRAAREKGRWSTRLEALEAAVTRAVRTAAP